MIRLLFVLLLLQINSPAGDLSDLRYTFINNRTEVQITRCLAAASGSLEIPSAIRGKPVRSIKHDAFANCAQLTHITVPGTVRRIPHNAFRGCSALEYVDFGEGVEEFGVHCFLQCSKLKRITLPSSLERVHATSFSGVQSLESFEMSQDGSHYAVRDGVLYDRDVTTLECLPKGRLAYVMPDSVSAVQAWAVGDNSSLKQLTVGAGLVDFPATTFARCEALEECFVSGSNSSLSAHDGVLYRDTTELVYYPPAGDMIATPRESTTQIGDYAFYGREVSEVRLPDGLKGIGVSAFRECKQLQSISLPTGVELVGDGAFADCRSLEWVRFSEALQRIGDEAFQGCNALQLVSIPDEVTEIGERAFAQCALLEEVHFSESLIQVGDAAFSECSRLESIHFNASLESVGDEAFFGCHELRGVKLPKNVRRVGEYGFAENTKLRYLSIPSSVQSLGEWCVEACSLLESVTFYGDNPIADLELLGSEELTVFYYLEGASGFEVVESGVSIEVIQPDAHPAAYWLLANDFGYDRSLLSHYGNGEARLIDKLAFGLGDGERVSDKVGMHLTADGSVFRYYSAEESVQYRVERSLNLRDWVAVDELSVRELGGGVHEITVSVSDVGEFYRLAVEVTEFVK
jgi:hypothetical protein